MTTTDPFIAYRTWRNVCIPLAPGSLATVGYPHPLTEAEWEQFARVWETMKPGLVSDDTPSVAEEDA